MNVLITGSKGFIGSHLATVLSTTYTVVSPSHRQLDLLDEHAVLKYIQRHAIDVVIHCAVLEGSTPEIFGQNLRMFFNIARCKQYYTRLIHIGSGAEYDKRYPIIHVREVDIEKHIPVDDYGLYKYICAKYIACSDGRVDLRVFGIFGEGEDYRRRFISNAMCRTLYGLPITIKQNVVFDYLDVLDFVKIVDYFIRHKPKYTAYNVGCGKKIDLISIAKEIQKLSDNTGDTVIIGKQLLANEYTCNTNRLLREYSGFKPTPIARSLQRLFLWYTKHKTRMNKKEL